MHAAVLMKYLQHYKLIYIEKQSYKPYSSNNFAPKWGAYKINYCSFWMKLKNRFLRHVYLFIDTTRMYLTNLSQISCSSLWTEIKIWKQQHHALSYCNTVKVFDTAECQSLFIRRIGQTMYSIVRWENYCNWLCCN